MTISRLLQSHAYEPEAIRTITAAYEDALRHLGLVERTDPLTEIVAKTVLQCAQRGECDPVRLRDRAIEELRSN